MFQKYFIKMIYNFGFIEITWSSLSSFWIFIILNKLYFYFYKYFFLFLNLVSLYHLNKIIWFARFLIEYKRFLESHIESLVSFNIIFCDFILIYKEILSIFFLNWNLFLIDLYIPFLFSTIDIWLILSLEINIFVLLLLCL